MSFGQLSRRHFGDLLSEGNFWDWAEGRTQILPAVDVEETQNEYIFRAELPGVDKDQVKIALADNVLTISGEKRSEERKSDRTYHRVERLAGSFRRTYSLSQPLQADKVSARYKDGVLEITVPKAEEAKPREIQIQVQ
ncbi:MAG TPA: Hsp20/alpha crystallin family protein [bacterium]|nr:Hsp20/alpha crystallin family protein [bacterium]